MTDTEATEQAEDLGPYDDDMRVAYALVRALDEKLTAARAALGASILNARAHGATVPHCADVLGQSEANIFRISAMARKAAAAPKTNGK